MSSILYYSFTFLYVSKLVFYKIHPYYRHGLLQMTIVFLNILYIFLIFGWRLLRRFDNLSKVHGLQHHLHLTLPKVEVVPLNLSMVLALSFSNIAMVTMCQDQPLQALNVHYGTSTQNLSLFQTLKYMYTPYTLTLVPRRSKEQVSTSHHLINFYYNIRDKPDRCVKIWSCNVIKCSNILVKKKIIQIKPCSTKHVVKCFHHIKLS